MVEEIQIGIGNDVGNRKCTNSIVTVKVLFVFAKIQLSILGLSILIFGIAGFKTS